MARPKYPSDEQEQFMVRMPAGMRARIKHQAEANNRSMNAEIIMRLEDSLMRSGFDDLDRRMFEDSEEMKAVRAEHQSSPPDMSGFYKLPDGVSGDDLNRFIRQGIAEAFEKAGVMRQQVLVNMPDEEKKK